MNTFRNVCLSLAVFATFASPHLMPQPARAAAPALQKVDAASAAKMKWAASIDGEDAALLRGPSGKVYAAERALFKQLIGEEPRPAKRLLVNAQKQLFLELPNRELVPIKDAGDTSISFFLDYTPPELPSGRTGTVTSSNLSTFGYIQYSGGAGGRGANFTLELFERAPDGYRAYKRVEGKLLSVKDGQVTIAEYENRYVLKLAGAPPARFPKPGQSVVAFALPVGKTLVLNPNRIVLDKVQR